MKGLEEVEDTEATQTGEESGRKDGGGKDTNFLWKHPLFPHELTQTRKVTYSIANTKRGRCRGITSRHFKRAPGTVQFQQGKFVLLNWKFWHSNVQETLRFTLPTSTGPVHNAKHSPTTHPLHPLRISPWTISQFNYPITGVWQK